MPHWNPKKPNAKITDLDSLLANAGAQSILIPELAAVNGPTKFLQFLGLLDDTNTTSPEDFLGKPKQIAALQEVNNLLPELEQLSLRSVVQQAERMHEESDGAEDRQIHEFRNEIQRRLLNANNSNEGYIIWLDIAAKNKVNSVIFSNTYYC
jgi:hypothetical protein